ncbi:MAG: hypothetical protein JJU44_11970 [Planctomycetes bacterium]|nr:hypothetical protein [Planctomycetota bacterium]
MHARAACLAITAASLAAHAGGPISWADPFDGIWNLATNWDPAVIPGASDAVLLALKGPYTVSVSTNESAGGITIANPDAVLSINPGRTLSLFGSVANAGRIDINPTNTASTTTLSFAGPAMLSGPGAVRLSSPTSRAQLGGADAAAVVTHGADHTIHGFGQITAPMVNNGLISADEPGQTLGMITHPKQNNAVMEAVNAGTLLVQNITIDQSASGLLLADGAGSTLTLSGAVINGGTIAGSDGGLIEFISSASTINAVTLGGLAEIVPGRTVRMENSLNNNATLIINPTNTAQTTTLTAPAALDLTGSGQIVLAGTATRSQISSATGATITHGQDHTIRGTGRINAALINNGQIIADSDLGEMLLTSQDKTNNNLIRAAGDGTLALSGFTLGQAPAAEVISDGPGSLVTLSGMTVQGGAIRSVNAGLIEFVSASSVLDSVTLGGDAEIAAGRTVTIQNSLNNNTTLTINPTNTSFTTTLTAEVDTELNGTGTIHLAGTATRSRITSIGSAVITHGADHTIEGTGTIQAAMINNGTITADSALGVMTLSSLDKTNNNTIRAIGQGVIALSGISLDQSPGAAVISDGPDSRVTVSTTTITGGAVRSINGGLIEFTGNSTIDAVALEGHAEIRAGRTVSVDGATILNGLLDINPTNTASTTSLQWLDDITLNGDGVIRLSGLSTRSILSNAFGVTETALGAGIRLEGIGRIDTPLTIHGTLAPGLSIGTLGATNPITLAETATLEIEVAGDDDSDRIDSSSQFHAAGTLDITFVDDFDPPLYWSTTIANTGANGVSGRFDTINAPTPGDPRLEVRVQYRTNEIRVGAFCRADVNFDGVANFFDISDFIALYNAQDPAADIAPPFGVWNFFDIAEFITRYNEGCP